MAKSISSLIAILGILLLGSSHAWSQTRARGKDEFIKGWCASYTGTPKANVLYYAARNGHGLGNAVALNANPITISFEEWTYIIPIEGDIGNVRPEDTIKNLLARDYFNKSAPHLYMKITRGAGISTTYYEPPQDENFPYISPFTTYDKNNRKVSVSIRRNTSWNRAVNMKTRTLFPFVPGRSNNFCDFTNLTLSDVSISTSVRGVEVDGLEINALAIIFRRETIGEIILTEIRF
jgi:hypothetical protein